MPAKKKQKSGSRETAGQASSTTTQTWPRHLLQIAALLILVFAAYSNSLDSGLVFDNSAIIGNDPRIRTATPESIGLIFTKEYWYPSNNSGLYRPLTTLSYLINYAVFGNGTNPAGYHLVNLLAHAVNVLLVYWLGWMILGGSVPAFALAALWGVHPLLTESVTNIVGRADLLAGFGVLAGLLSYMRALSTKGRKRIAWLAALAGAQTVGLFSKESAASLPALMLIYDFTWKRSQTWRGRVVPYVVLAIPFGVFFYLRSEIGTHLAVRFTENSLVGAGFLTGRITAVKVIGKFVWLFLWPAHLSADYSFNAVPLFAWRPWTWEDAKALIAIAACAGMIVLAIRFRRLKPLVFFVAFFFVAIAPTSNLFILIGSLMAERFMYLPALALCGCVIVAIQQIRMQPWQKWAAIGAACLAFGIRTYARNSDWRDSATLWSSAVESTPESARAHLNYGVALVTESDFPRATGEFETALRILPDYTHAHVSLGNELSRIPGREQDAITQYEAALRLDPDMVDAHYNLGIVLARMPGRSQDAIDEWKTTTRLQPDRAEAHYNLGTAYSQLPGRLPEAIAELQTALRLRPDYAEAHNNLASIYFQLPDRRPDAIAEYQAALRIRPDWAEAHNSLGIVLSQTPGRLPEAIDQYEQAIRLQPSFGEAHYRLGMALLQTRGRERDAIAELEAAWHINPDPQGRRMIDELRARLH